MATVNKTRLAHANEKKVYSVAAARLKVADFSGTDTLQLFTIPENCLITAARCVVKTAGQANLVLDMGLTASGNELQNDLDVDAASVVGGALTTAIDSGTGKTVYLTPSAAPTAGEFDIIVEYIEYRRNNGELSTLIG